MQAMRQDWRGGYVLTDAGELAYLPAPLEFQGERVLFYGLGAHPGVLGFLPSGGVAIDIGANLGEWTVALAKAVGPGGRVLAFEPNPLIADALARTLRINNLAQARVLRLALSNRDGSAHFLVSRGNSGESRLGEARPGMDGFDVRIRRLDDIVAEKDLVRLDLVKIDVEGHERWVLEGAEESLRRFRPAVIIESAHEGAEERAAIAGFFERLGYDLVAVLHDFGALPTDFNDYRAAAAACAGTEARNLLLLPTRLDAWLEGY